MGLPAYWGYDRSEGRLLMPRLRRVLGRSRGIGELSTHRCDTAISRGKSILPARAWTAFRGVNGSGTSAQPASAEDADRPGRMRTFHYRDNGAFGMRDGMSQPAGKELREVRYAPDLSIVKFEGGSKGRLQMQAKFLPAEKPGVVSKTTRRDAEIRAGAGKSRLPKWKSLTTWDTWSGEPI